MAADLPPKIPTAGAAKLAAEMGRAAVDGLSFMADLGEELPLLKPVLKTLGAIRAQVETVKSNREDLEALHGRCTYLTACLVMKCREGSTSEIDTAPLEECVEAVRQLVKRCRRRHKLFRVLRATRVKEEISGLHSKMDSLRGDVTLAGIAALKGKADCVAAMLESQAGTQGQILANQEIMVSYLPKPSTKLAEVPKGTPVRKGWHVERRHVMTAVVEALAGDEEPCLVGLVGGSGSGKTTVASEIVRSPDVRKAFSDGIVWLTVNPGATHRLASLMLQLARMVHEEVAGSVGRRPAESDDGVMYIRRVVEGGNGRKGLKCLVVLDNVWDKEVVSRVLETGMWVVVSTRTEELVTTLEGKAVEVDELSEADAESVLRSAAELPPASRLPDDAFTLVELCGRVAMDVAFVGRWSTVRGRKDRAAWSDAVRKVRDEIGKIGVDPGSDGVAEIRVRRRKAVLQAGFDDLATGSDDTRVQRLYLSLAVFPDGFAFTAAHAAVLLYDRSPSDDDQASVQGVVAALERWSVLRSEEGGYRMHDAHSGFARENLLDRGDVRRPAVRRWVAFISSLDALRAFGRDGLKAVWQAVEDVGGDPWAVTRPYARALADLSETDPAFREHTESVAWFQAAQKDWEGASATWRKLLEAERRELGGDHPYVLNTYRSLVDCAERLGDFEEAAEWGRQEREVFPQALAKMRRKIDRGEGAEASDGTSLASVASTMLQLAPEKGDEAEKLLRQSLEIMEARHSTEHAWIAHALCRLGGCVLQAGMLGEAEELLKRSVELQEAGSGPGVVHLGDTLLKLGECVRQAGRLEESEELLRRCLSILEASLGRQDIHVATSLHWLGLCLRERGRLGESEEMLRRCLSITEAKWGDTGVELVVILQDLGSCLRDARRFEEAEEVLRRCLAIEEAKLGPDHVALTNTLSYLSSCLREGDRLGEAEALLRRCLRIEETFLGENDVKVASTLYVLGAHLRQAGRAHEAVPLLRRCLTIEEAHVGRDDLGIASTLNQLGMCLRESGEADEALGLMRRRLAIEESNLGPADLRVANTFYELGLWVRQTGRTEEAAHMFRRCLAVEEAELGADDVQITYTLNELAECARALTRWKEAEELLRRCLAIQRADSGADDAGVADTLFQLGVCLRRAGRPEEAITPLRDCLEIREGRCGGEDDDAVGHARRELDACLGEAGRHGEAGELSGPY
ncbi:unnamed protein product [Scytosiphon promiscuus]